MRTLIAVVVALLALGAAPPAFGSALPAIEPGAALGIRGEPGAGPAGVVRASKKKSSKESAKFEEIGNAKRGKSDFEIKIKVSKSEWTCELKIKWNNGDTTSDEEDANDDKICEFSIEVPKERDTVGDATATVTVRNANGKKVASAKKTFEVK